ncbi:hypothetical protein DFH08DRAFT_521389 [Mycena albidolilacea]|uniref:Uncharacterized protein n=1 Tax=Mycena albidolilacea TaxID=1033008 RepID=A0AAD7E9H5_9AGAR|nr:hypothetical protein DFH08DRAFT_521389 [Mycena albidolilacea]
MGPNAVAFDHVDVLNVHAICAVTCAGNFKYTLGAHLYMRQFKVICEFPSGATILLPSGVVHHGNTPFHANDNRHSITQYAAGGLFRWAAYGQQSAKSLLSKPGGATLKAQFDGEPGQRWKSVGLFFQV